MNATFFSDTTLFQLVLLPALIVILRISDVTVGTLRIMYVSRGLKGLSAILGFFEVLLWLFAIGQILNNLTNPITYIAFAGGFAAGNYIGILVEERLSLGYQMFRIFLKSDATRLISNMREARFGATLVNAEGMYGPVQVLLTIVPRRQASKLLRLVNDFDKDAFYTVEEIKSIHSNNLSSLKPFAAPLWHPKSLLPWRPSKVSGQTMHQ
jgi:uncharacterized protein YebE (UPF0316 family)